MPAAHGSNKRVLIFATLLILAAALFPRFADAQTLPKTEEEALTGDKVDLQEALRGKIGILLVGFSKKSGDQTTAWAKDMLAEFRDTPSVAIFELPILEGAPKLIRGFIVGNMKKDIPHDLQPRFIPVFHNEKQWKELVEFSAEDDPYILVVDRDQKVIWRTHGPFEPKRKAEVLDRVRSLRKASPAA